MPNPVGRSGMKDIFSYEDGPLSGVKNWQNSGFFNRMGIDIGKNVLTSIWT